MPPLETRIFLSPRGKLPQAPLDWFRLQRGWWRGAGRDMGPQLKLPDTPNTVDLSDQWAYRVLDEEGTGDPAPLAAPELDDADWPRRPLNCWAVDEELSSRRVFFRKTFTVPGAWRDGEVSLWIRSYFANTVVGKARYWLDGRDVPAGDGSDGLIRSVDWVPGSRHCLAVEIRGEGEVCGVRGNTWLAFTPTPRERLDLAGEWRPSTDFLRWGESVVVPGPLPGLRCIRRQVRLPETWRDSGQVYLHVKGGYAITGAIVNGNYLRRHHHALGEVTSLNVTLVWRSDALNEIELILNGGNDTRIDTAELRLHAEPYD